MLQQYIETGEGRPLPADLRNYMDALDIVRSMYDKYTNKRFIVRALKGMYPDMSQHLANKLYYDAIQFFNLDKGVKKDAWRNFYAEKLEDLAIYAIEKDDLETARRCYATAAEMRGLHKDDDPVVPEEFFTRPVVVYVTDPEAVGIPKADREELKRQIDALPDLTPQQKERIMEDAGVIRRKALLDDAEVVD